MNRYGQAARFAYNPEAVLAYLEHLHDIDAVRGDVWDDAIQGRTVRRWRSAHGITRSSFNRVFGCYNGVGEKTYVAWAESQGLAPILRNYDSKR